ncbi:MAG: hypothetical protein COY40_03635 [Alphaproteobacteria bacterium CG_4_10_14_0_8_um_filter_53_9]|nr:MAG: hypothetical protein COY40_03635 [Alphaproteobacteria bacterium CG_4_10_14_0_8_um_filter_53_9]
MHWRAVEPVLCTACYKALPWWNKELVVAPVMPAAIDSFTAPFLYDGPVREVILGLKFSGGVRFAPLLAGWMADAVGVVPANALIVPVPSHASRLRWRGFSHTAVLARTLARRLGCEVSLGGLTRLTKTDGQVHKTRKQRLALRGVDFAADARVFEGRHVMLLDDIVTTGGTVRACAIALKRAGAVRVDVVSVAYTAGR